MNKFGAYKILKKERIIIEYHAGNINIEEFINSRNIVSSDIDYSSDMDVIFDYREANMIVNHHDIERFVKIFKNTSKIVGNRKSAYLTKKPKHLVVTTLFSQGIKDTPVLTETFSTLKAAVSWVGNVNLNVNKLKLIIEELKKSSNTLYV